MAVTLSVQYIKQASFIKKKTKQKTNTAASCELCETFLGIFNQSDLTCQLSDTDKPITL